MRISGKHCALAVIAVAAVTLSLAPATSAKPPTGETTASAKIFMVNPVQSSGDQSLTDMKDSASAVLPTDYATVPLDNLTCDAALARDGLPAANAVKARFAARGITF